MNAAGGKIYGYALAGRFKQDATAAQQQEDINAHVAELGLGQVDGHFGDAAAESDTPVLARKAGRALFARLRHGDTLVVTDLDRMVTRPPDAALVLEHLDRIGAEFRVVGLGPTPVTAAGPDGRPAAPLVAMLARAQHTAHSERQRRVMAIRGRAGFRTTIHAGYGFTWEKFRDRDGKVIGQRRVPDPVERGIMKEIARWRLQDPPLAWAQIEQELRYNRRLVTKFGREWTLDRIKDCCQAEFRLQIQEQRPPDPK